MSIPLEMRPSENLHYVTGEKVRRESRWILAGESRPDNGSLHPVPETFSAVTAVVANMMADYTNKVVLGAT